MTEAAWDHSTSYHLGGHVQMGGHLCGHEQRTATRDVPLSNQVSCSRDGPLAKLPTMCQLATQSVVRKA